MFRQQGLFEWLKSAELRSTEEFMVGNDLESVKEQLCDLKVSSYAVNTLVFYYKETLSELCMLYFNDTISVMIYLFYLFIFYFRNLSESFIRRK